MVNIQPVQVFTNYGTKNAVKFNLDSINDNLENFCIFQYQLCDINDVILYSGNLTMNDPDYRLWNEGPNINNDAYVWATTELGINIIP
jgi:hypothetical protein